MPPAPGAPGGLGLPPAVLAQIAWGQYQMNVQAILSIWQTTQEIKRMKLRAFMDEIGKWSNAIDAIAKTFAKLAAQALGRSIQVTKAQNEAHGQLSA